VRDGWETAPSLEAEPCTDGSIDFSFLRRTSHERSDLQPVDVVGDLEAAQVLIRGLLSLTNSTIYRAPPVLKAPGGPLSISHTSNVHPQELLRMTPINRLKRWPFPGKPIPDSRPQADANTEQRNTGDSRKKQKRGEGSDNSSKGS
jgi:hypothetical protein